MIADFGFWILDCRRGRRCGGALRHSSSSPSGCLHGLSPIQNPKSKSQNPGLRTGFTLVEMMAVVTIIGLMLLVAIPALNTTGGSAQINNAARQFNNALVAARQAAITRNTRTRVAIYTQSVSGDPNQTMRYCTYAILALPSRTTNLVIKASTADLIKDWRYLQSWRHLPNGVIFDPSQATITANDGTYLEGSTIFKTGVDMPFPNDASPTTRRMSCVEFSSIGTPTASACVRVANGRVDLNGNPIILGRRSVLSPSAGDDPAKKNSVVLSWDDAIGRVNWIQPGL